MQSATMINRTVWMLACLVLAGLLSGCYRPYIKSSYVPPDDTVATVYIQQDGDIEVLDSDGRLVCPTCPTEIGHEDLEAVSGGTFRFLEGSCYMEITWHGGIPWLYKISNQDCPPGFPGVTK